MAKPRGAAPAPWSLAGGDDDRACAVAWQHAGVARRAGGSIPTRRRGRGGPASGAGPPASSSITALGARGFRRGPIPPAPAGNPWPC